MRVLFPLLLIALGLALGAALLRERSRILATPIHSWTQDHVADCAVVLTGGPSRIREGIDLLSHHEVRKLIISGVHPSAEYRDIFPIWPFYGEVDEADVVLERKSRTTWGNAQQSLPLVEALHCRDLVLVTSRLHLYRALRTFQAEFPPGISIYPRAVIWGSIYPDQMELTIESVKSIFYSLWAY